MGLEKKGSQHRIDFVMIAESWEVEAHSAGPLPDVDISAGTLDHSLVIANTVARMAAGQGTWSRRRHICDEPLLAQL